MFFTVKISDPGEIYSGISDLNIYIIVVPSHSTDYVAHLITPNSTYVYNPQGKYFIISYLIYS